MEIDDSEAVRTVRRAKELLDKLAEYKPLAKIEELEEQNYNMIDNVLACGAWSICWRAMDRTTQVPMLMCHKVTYKN